MQPETSLSQHAARQLSYIRDAMAGAIEFTAVPGRGLVLIGTTALLVAVAAQGLPAHAALVLWSMEGVAAIAVGLLALQRKTRRLGFDLTRAPARKFVLALLPAGIFATALSATLWWRGLDDLVPAVWLAGYGTGVIAAGAHSVPAVPAMGGAFLLLGLLALLLPADMQNLALVIGFGGLHIVFGSWIARHHGG